MQLLRWRPDAHRHLAAINPSFVSPALEQAGHYVRVIENRHACQAAVQLMSPDEPSLIESGK